MNVLCTGDWHLRFKRPRARIDEYYLSQMQKLAWILNTAKEHTCSVILQAGDFFDHRNVPNQVLTDTIAQLKDQTPIYTIYGQHDLRFHKNYENTALGVLAATGLVTILSSNPTRISDGSGTIHLYGASFGEEIPKPNSPDDQNILVMHRMVIHKEKLWADQTDFLWGRDLHRDESDYDLILCGDNHQQFHIGSKFGAVLLNPGSLMRTNIDQIDHKPAVYIVDTNTGYIKKVYIPIQPAGTVFNLQQKMETTDTDARLAAFVEYIAKDYRVDIDFMANLQTLLAEVPQEDPIHTIINNLLDEIHTGGVNDENN